MDKGPDIAAPEGPSPQQEASVVGSQIGIGEFADLCGVTMRTIQLVIQAGYIPRLARGQLGLKDAMRGWTAYLEHKVTEASKRAAGNEATRARAREIEQRTAERSKVLMPTADAFAVVDEVLGAFRQELDGLASWITRDPKEKRRVDQRLDEINASAIQRLDKIRRRLSSRDNDSQATAPPVAGRVGRPKSGIPKQRGRPRTQKP